MADRVESRPELRIVERPVGAGRRVIPVGAVDAVSRSPINEKDGMNIDTLIGLVRQHLLEPNPDSISVVSAVEIPGLRKLCEREDVEYVVDPNVPPGRVQIVERRVLTGPPPSKQP